MSQPLSAAARAEARAILLADPRFQAMPTERLARLIDAGEWRLLPADARLFSAGDESRAVLAVASGFLAFDSALTVPEVPLFNFGPAPFWSVGRPQVQGRIRLVTATARTPLTVLSIPITRFEALEARDPLVRDFKAMIVAQIFLDTLEALADALIPAIPQRAVTTLLRIAGRKHGGDAPVTVPISQVEFSALTNVSRQTCGEWLRSIEREGLIRLGYRRIELLSPAGLRAKIP